MTGKTVKIGTRGSPLALAQAEEVKERLCKVHPHLSPDESFEICIIKTTGDKIQDRPLSEVGGKGLFTKEIEEALLSGAIDLAVHSMKDMPTWQPEGLGIMALLPREDVRDAYLTRDGGRLEDLPEGAVVGSASLRRQAQLKAWRPDLKVVTIRGNVQTRMRKLREGEVDATLLALAGLKRLDLEEAAAGILSAQEMLPAPAQGAIGIEIRLDDPETAALIAPLNDPETELRLSAERACLAELDGSCRTPIAALAELKGGELHLEALIALPDGTRLFREKETCAANLQPATNLQSATNLGRTLGARLKEAAGRDFFALLEA